MLGKGANCRGSSVPKPRRRHVPVPGRSLPVPGRSLFASISGAVSGALRGGVAPRFGVRGVRGVRLFGNQHALAEGGARVAENDEPRLVGLFELWKTDGRRYAVNGR